MLHRLKYRPIQSSPLDGVDQGRVIFAVFPVTVNDLPKPSGNGTRKAKCKNPAALPKSAAQRWEGRCACIIRQYLLHPVRSRDAASIDNKNRQGAAWRLT